MKSQKKVKEVKAKANKPNSIKGKTVRVRKPRPKKESKAQEIKRLKATFLELLVHEDVLGNVSYACKKISRSRYTVYEWRSKDKKFADDWDRIKVEADELLADEAENYLLKGIRAGSATLIIYTLNNRRGDRWRARLEHTGEGGGPVEHAVSPEFAKLFGLENEKRTNKKIKPDRS